MSATTTVKASEKIIYPEDLLQGGMNYYLEKEAISFKFKFRFTKQYAYHYYSMMVIDGIKYKRLFHKEETVSYMVRELNKIATNEKYREQFKA